MTGDSRHAANPYVGPRSFEAGERRFFFGREEETAILAGLVMARRAALFYAQSGAGKTSLLRAGLIPELIRTETQRRGSRVRTYQKMRVLPVATVGGAIPARIERRAANVFSCSALLSLYPASPPEQLAVLTLAEGLAPLLMPTQDPGDVMSSAGVLLIFDQFEQLFSAHLQRWAEREPFFKEVAQALAAYPGLHVLFTMREDYIAELTPFAHLLPEDLRPRFRLERLQRPAAIQAVIRPAEAAGRRYASGVAEGLVDNLRRAQTRRQRAGESAPGEEEGTLAAYVEPVHLQIVCRQLWSQLPPERKVIQTADVQAFGDVDQALSDFYEATLARVTAETELSERRLRRWFDEQLITPARTRALVYRDEEHTEGLPNEAVDILNGAYLIRAHIRGDDTWYELVHDRLVEPLLASNRDWWAHFSHPLAGPLEQWLAAERSPEKLLSGAALAEAEAYAAANPRDILEEERAYLSESQRVTAAREEAERQSARRRRNVRLAGLGVMIALATLTLWALRNAAEAERQAQLARSRELAAAAIASLPVDPELAILLARQAQLTVPTSEAADALRQALFSSRIVQRLDAPAGACSRVAQAEPGSHGALMRLAAPPAQAGGGQDRADEVGDPEAAAGEEDELRSLALSPDGSLLAAANAGGCLFVWDLEANRSSGQEIPPLLIPSRGEPVWDLTFSPDGRRLAAALGDGTAQIWDALTGEHLVAVEGGDDLLSKHLDDVVAVAYSPDGRYLATASLDRTARVWDADSGQEALAPFIGHRNGLTGVAFSPDGSNLATASQDGTVRIWELASGQMLHILEGHTEAVRSLAYSPDGRYLASGSLDKTAILWDVSGAEPVRLVTLQDHTDTVTALDFSPSGLCLATGGPDRTVRVWSVPSGRLLLSLPGHTHWVTGVTFRAGTQSRDPLPPTMPCGQEIASSSRDGTVRLWNSGPTAEVASFVGHLEPVEAAAFSPDGQRIASGSDDGVVIIWDAASGRPWRQWQAHNDRVNRVAFSPDGRLLATAGYDGLARLWDADSSEPVGNPLEHGVWVYSLAFSPDGALLATAADDGLLRLWEVPAGALVREPLDHGGSTYGVAFAPDGSLLASTGTDGAVKVWQLPSGALTFSAAHSGVVYDAVFSRDGSRLAAVSWDGTAALWNVDGGERTALLSGHTDRLYGVGFTSDGDYLVTSSADGTVRLWDVSTASVAGTIPGPEMNSLDVRADGRQLVVGGEDGTVRLYTLEAAELLALAEQRLTRAFSDEECRRYFLSLEACREVVDSDP
jgi:WD40 repeat protein